MVVKPSPGVSCQFIELVEFSENVRVSTRLDPKSRSGLRPEMVETPLTTLYYSVKLEVYKAVNFTFHEL